MENDKKKESETQSYAFSSNNLPSKSGKAIKVFEKNLERLENLVKLFKSDVNKMFVIFDSNSSDSEVEIEEATKLKEYLSQSRKPIIDIGSDLTILSEEYVNNQSRALIISSEELLCHAQRLQPDCTAK
ncbi:hypothetical protein RclHR1_26240002 [Rhizophagus clarus]|uniref:Uncharacterized protein n=1 Tax=Rhizophagus clarus TaxID=94130 RepID=A0A2Z6R0S8_9GLOM|nr:hypothetical protein RclHR1_26240002 [Rhizophagus clarus]GES85553.1 hypothetical protein RCL_e11445_RclHR1_26240002 [Rhizophagus clarus]